MMERKDHTTGPSVTSLVAKLQRQVSELMDRNELTDEARAARIVKINDGMPGGLAGVEVMLMTRPGSSAELAYLIPEQLARFFAGRSIMSYAAVIVEERSEGLFFVKNRYGVNGQVPSLEGEVVLSQVPLITATFATPRSPKAV